jgi:hypothetical protein
MKIKKIDVPIYNSTLTLIYCKNLLELNAKYSKTLKGKDKVKPTDFAVTFRHKNEDKSIEYCVAFEIGADISVGYIAYLRTEALN